ncbi:SixA phosphatase family protein [Sabulibacter ruber]|uniref:SixA phosphatase family protein n=1 Tax=Sabulibacter ruber TaxID=2811901 RepID=UPI001A957D2A|nr:phosphoglycerate mutase family protein [Sabulibacter ruber]
MKQIKSLFLLGLCFLAVFSLFDCLAQKASSGKATVVYVVRHAEKAASNGTMTDDPALSEAGRKRAEVLRDKLAKSPIAALLATKYQRTQQTLQPLAQAKNLTVQTYNPTDFLGLAQNIRENYKGKTVVIAGHSNTVLSVVEALGGKRPFNEVADYQYDQLFKVTLRDGKDTQVEVQQYGEPSVAPAK